MGASSSAPTDTSQGTNLARNRDSFEKSSLLRKEVPASPRSTRFAGEDSLTRRDSGISDESEGSSRASRRSIQSVSQASTNASGKSIQPKKKKEPKPTMDTPGHFFRCAGIDRPSTRANGHVLGPTGSAQSKIASSEPAIIETPGQFFRHTKKQLAKRPQSHSPEATTRMRKVSALVILGNSLSGVSGSRAQS